MFNECRSEISKFSKQQTKQGKFFGEKFSLFEEIFKRETFSNQKRIKLIGIKVD